MHFNQAPFHQTLLLGAMLTLGRATTTLLGQGTGIFLGDTTPQACLKAFNTPLKCDEQVQLLSYDMDRLEFTQSKLEAVCTPSCLSSLHILEALVGSACKGYAIPFSGSTLPASDIVSLFRYKYHLSCLKDTPSGSFCLMLEEEWDVGALESSGNITWPKHTHKIYPDFTYSDVGEQPTDIDGTLIDQSDPTLMFNAGGLTDLPWSAHDYFQTGAAADWIGHGWPDPLEYDEYPLEIQCSECFLSQYKTGVESKWGEVFDEVSDQAWRNMKLNCHLDWDVKPARNLSTWKLSTGPLTWDSATTKCERTVQVGNVNSGGSGINGVKTVNDIARMYNAPTKSVLELNEWKVSYNSVKAGQLCLPEPCEIAVIKTATSSQNYATWETNVTVIQFWDWNPYMTPWFLAVDEVVCVGPPGGTYTPVAGHPANPSFYTTIEIPAGPTPNGTVANCGHYYEVVKGDGCNTIAMAHSLTFAQFRAMNPSIDDTCSNLQTGLEYCVALVSGSR